jgi:signal peptidase I
MIGSVERYSSPTGRRRVNVLGGRLMRVLIIAFVLYLIVFGFVASTYRIESASMEPGLLPSDRVIVSSLSFGARVPFFQSRLPGLGVPARGDLVVIRPPFLEEPGLLWRIAEPLAAFLSLQKATLHRDLYGSRVNAYMVKRIVGMPGDTVRMKDYILLIKPRGAADFVPEQQLIPVRYQVLTSLTARGWSASLPFSGNGGEQVLQAGEYFVLGDNRPDSSDSRSWGALAAERIVGKLIYRYWPPRSIGKL